MMSHPKNASEQTAPTLSPVPPTSHPPTQRQSFPKSRRLRGRNAIKNLFQRGKVIHFPTLRVHYLPQPHLTEDQVIILVSKKYFPSAPIRNTIKRRTREAYRLTHPPSHTHLPKCHIALVYHATHIPSVPTYAQLSQDIRHALQRIKRKHPASHYP